MAATPSRLYSYSKELFPAGKEETSPLVKALEDITGGLVRPASIERVDLVAKSEVRMAVAKWPSLPLYVLLAEKVIALTINVIISGGGPAGYIKPRVEAITPAISSDMRKIARVLITEDAALETLLMLAEEGPLDVGTLSREVIPEDRMLRVVSELSRCDLVKVTGKVISLTSEAMKMVVELQKNLQDKR